MPPALGLLRGKGQRPCLHPAPSTSGLGPHSVDFLSVRLGTPVRFPTPSGASGALPSMSRVSAPPSGVAWNCLPGSASSSTALTPVASAGHHRDRPEAPRQVPRGKAGAHRAGHQPAGLALLHARLRGLVPLRVLCQRVQAALLEQEGSVCRARGLPRAGEQRSSGDPGVRPWSADRDIGVGWGGAGSSEHRAGKLGAVGAELREERATTG